uniref:Uncharacterized protein n=1 Tax=Oryza punctata TaxID=4537 RepID=A0A0E0KMS3_ORYPU
MEASQLEILPLTGKKKKLYLRPPKRSKTFAQIDSLIKEPMVGEDEEILHIISTEDSFPPVKIQCIILIKQLEAEEREMLITRLQE